MAQLSQASQFPAPLRSSRGAVLLVMWVLSSSCGFRSGFEPLPAPLGAVDGGVVADAAAGDPDASAATRYDEHGAGTVEDPYLIATAAQWVHLASDRSAWGAAYKLIADIDLSAIAGDHTPIGTELAPFTGVLDGNQKIVSNYYNQSGDSYLGPFGYVNHADALIHDIAIRDADILSSELSAGLIGQLESGTVERAATFGPGCYVRSPGYANHKGGLIGHTGPDAVVTDVFSNCRLGGGGAGVAGLIGHNEGALTNGYYQNSTHLVTGSNRVGGLIGWNYVSADVRNTFTSVGVEGNSSASDTALHIGTLSSVAENSFFDSAPPVTNIGTGGTQVNGIPVDVAATPGYFHDRANPPMSSWDFDQVWSEQTGDYPILRWLDGRM